MGCGRLWSVLFYIRPPGFSGLWLMIVPSDYQLCTHRPSCVARRSVPCPTLQLVCQNRSDRGRAKEALQSSSGRTQRGGTQRGFQHHQRPTEATATRQTDRAISVHPSRQSGIHRQGSRRGRHHLAQRQFRQRWSSHVSVLAQRISEHVFQHAKPDPCGRGLVESEDVWKGR